MPGPSPHFEKQTSRMVIPFPAVSVGFGGWTCKLEGFPSQVKSAACEAPHPIFETTPYVSTHAHRMYVADSIWPEAARALLRVPTRGLSAHCDEIRWEKNHCGRRWRPANWPNMSSLPNEQFRKTKPLECYRDPGVSVGLGSWTLAWEQPFPLNRNQPTSRMFIGWPPGHVCHAGTLRSSTQGSLCCP